VISVRLGLILVRITLGELACVVRDIQLRLRGELEITPLFLCSLPSYPAQARTPIKIKIAKIYMIRYMIR
jgi:hypothetical protein